ncbi:SCAN domain-containing protein 3-like [Stegodyphus dumicola]|uniref:SCAN domain-containing protein 3-like n=1 Tax=Stegodyphus dumicola TaxID=202533 RepID=UPI0015ADA95F|nr:SCAN domain-containing protein 3-like [Stegodyphus dumicola]
MEHFDFQEDHTALELELTDFQNYLLSISLSSSSENIWPPVPKEKYPILVHVCLKVKAMFSSTYQCEVSFSSIKFIKNKYRNRSTDEHLDNCIRMTATTYSFNTKKLVDD